MSAMLSNFLPSVLSPILKLEQIWVHVLEERATRWLTLNLKKKRNLLSHYGVLYKRPHGSFIWCYETWDQFSTSEVINKLGPLLLLAIFHEGRDLIWFAHHLFLALSIKLGWNRFSKKIFLMTKYVRVYPDNCLSFSSHLGHVCAAPQLEVFLQTKGLLWGCRSHRCQQLKRGMRTCSSRRKRKETSSWGNI